MFGGSVLPLLLMFIPFVQPSAATIDITFGNMTDVYVTENEEADVNVTVVGSSLLDSIISFRSSNEFAFEVVNASASSAYIGENTAFPQTYAVRVRGKNLYVTTMQILVAAVGTNESTLVAEVTVNVLLPRNPFQEVIGYVLYVPIMVIYFLMGLTLDIIVVRETFKRPWAVFIGFFCQFTLMPAMAFGIGRMFQLDAPSAIGLFLVGCCPGGRLSNDLSILVDADSTLSITMTACSTFLALGMMPMNIFVYARFITDSGFEIPYDQIVIQLSSMFLPLAIGCFCRFKWPDLEKKAVRIVKPIVAIVVVVTGTVSIPFQLYVFYAPWQVYISSLLLPFFGAVAGGVLALIARLKKPQVFAIAFETGVQNGILAFIVLSNTFPSPDADIAGRVPFVGLMLQFLLAAITFLVYWLVKRFVIKDRHERDTGNDIKYDEDGDKSTMSNGRYRSSPPVDYVNTGADEDVQVVEGTMVMQTATD